MVDNVTFNLVPNDEEEEFILEFGELTNVGRGGTRDFNELENRPQYNGETMTGETNIPEVPSKVSDLDNDSGYQTGTEVQTAIETAIGGIEIPTKTSDLTNDGSDGTSTYVEADDLAEVATSGDYNDLSNKPTIPIDTTYSAGNAITIDENDNNRIDAAIYPADYFTASASQNGNGAIFSLNNTMAAALKGVELYGDTEQQTYTGKNLFDISKVVSSTQVVNNNDGTLTINAPSGSSTAAAGQPNKLSDYCPNLKVDDIATLSFDTTGSEKYIYLYGTGANFLWGTSTGTHTKTITQAMLDAQVLFYASGSSTTATISNFQIELGSTPTDFEPYVGGIPSPNPSYPQDIRVVSGGQTIKIDGKNLFSTESIVNGKRLDSSGNFVNDTNYMTSDFLPVKPNTTYTYSRYANGGGSACCCEYGEGQTFILRNFWNGQVNQQKTFFTFTTGENTHFIRICDFTALTKQLEFDDVSTEYEPYQNQSYTVNLAGDNLFDISKVINNSPSLINNGDGTLTVTAYGTQGTAPNTLSVYCPTLQAGDEVILSADTTSTNKFVYLAGTNTQWKFGDKRKILASDLTSRVLWYSDSASASATISNIEIAKPIELCKINDYRDYIFKSNGTWYLHKETGKAVLNGSETWAKANVSFQTTADITPGVVLSSNMSGYSNYFIHHYYASGISSNIQNGEFGWSGSRILTIRNDDCADANAFKTWLGTHNTDIYYQLATPTDTEITDVNLLNQLNALGSGKSYLDVTDFSVTASGTNLPAVLDVEVFDNSLAGMSGAIETKQDKLIAGENITIENNIISAAGGGSSINVVQTTGTSTEDVMSQNAVTSMIYSDPETQYKIKIGAGTSSSEGTNGVEIGHNAAATGNSSASIGYNAKAQGQSSTSVGYYSATRGEGSVAIGDNAFGGNSKSSAGATAVGAHASATQKGSVAVGAYSSTSVQGQMDIGTTQTGYGYNSTNYRLLSGVYDGQSAHDAVTVEQVNATIDAINTALSTNIPHIGA